MVLDYANCLYLLKGHVRTRKPKANGHNFNGYSLSVLVLNSILDVGVRLLPDAKICVQRVLWVAEALFQTSSCGASKTKSNAP